MLSEEIVVALAVDGDGNRYRLPDRLDYQSLCLVCNIWWDCSIVVRYESGYVDSWLPAIGNQTDVQRETVSQIKTRMLQEKGVCQ